MLLEGHFELTSGLHSGKYFEKFRLLEHPEITEQVCKKIAQKFEGKAKVVAGPTTGGIILAYEVARQLKGRCIFAEKSKDGRVIRRGFKLKKGEKVIVVDDILTTGGSILATIRAVEELGGKVIGVGVIIDRSEKEVSFNVPLFSVVKVKVKNWLPKECPLCKKGIPVTIPGGRKEGK
jgi:orotate phosphoribosyltransferase